MAENNDDADDIVDTRKWRVSDASREMILKLLYRVPGSKRTGGLDDKKLSDKSIIKDPATKLAAFPPTGETTGTRCGLDRSARWTNSGRGMVPRFFFDLISFHQS